LTYRTVKGRSKDVADIARKWGIDPAKLESILANVKFNHSDKIRVIKPFQIKAKKKLSYDY